MSGQLETKDHEHTMDDHEIDLDGEGMSEISVEWLPADTLDNGLPTGGYYYLKLECASTTMLISPDQMRAIKKAIDEATEGDPHLQQVLDWIDSHWDDLTEGNEDGECDANAWKCIKRNASDRWEALWRTYDCQDTLPPDYCRYLGIAAGSTYSQAADRIIEFLSKI